MAEVAPAETTSRTAIVFVGFMAAGKTKAALAVAERLGGEAVDADELIEQRVGEPIASFFEREGEAEFRRREEALVLELLGGAGERAEAPLVVALGGGAIESERVREALRGHLCVWCNVDEETAWERARGSKLEGRAAGRRFLEHVRAVCRRAPAGGGAAYRGRRSGRRDLFSWTAERRGLDGRRLQR